jgi:RNA polymerase sigma-70 factor (ECF subfamily)
MEMTFSKKQSTTAYVESETPDFEALFQQHWSRLCAVLYRLVGDWAEAEDLALEAFVRLYRRPPAEQRNLGGWLYRVATNMGLNALRSRQRRSQHEQQAGALDIQANYPDDPAAALESEQEREQVRTALRRIKPRSAQLLVLRHSGLSYAEIANALEISPGSVGTLLARAEQEFEKAYRKLYAHAPRD